jgi:hypothetical protein
MNYSFASALIVTRQDVTKWSIFIFPCGVKIFIIHRLLYEMCDENVRKIASDERSREEHAARTLNA